MSIPFVDLLAQHAEVADEVRAGLDEVFAATAFVGGPAVSAFEADYAAYVGAAHCIGVANGTDALELALRAVGVRPGGEVIIPANTFIATAEAASRIGAVPVPVDVDPVHLLMDPAAVRAAVGPRTEAIVPVHLFGQVAPVEELGKIAADAGVPLIEDAAQAQGARRNGRSAGTFGLAAGTSFKVPLQVDALRA
ncbi:MAG: aminotransferase class V-fold PLP-dependent enzyme, partial [Cellulomonas sp.]|nr:aminotransferase class V-fold PLP-dependent enzyme [Cellulomonas sp.]